MYQNLDSQVHRTIFIATSFQHDISKIFTVWNCSKTAKVHQSSTISCLQSRRLPHYNIIVASVIINYDISKYNLYLWNTEVWNVIFLVTDFLMKVVISTVTNNLPSVYSIPCDIRKNTHNLDNFKTFKLFIVLFKIYTQRQLRFWQDTWLTKIDTSSYSDIDKFWYLLKSRLAGSIVNQNVT